MSHLRKYDSLYRFGGEEFLIVLPDTPLQDAINIVERLRAGLEDLQIVTRNVPPFRVTASFGLVEVRNNRSVEESIEGRRPGTLSGQEGWAELA